MKQIRGAVIGIGGIGKWHGQMMRDTGRMNMVAACDVNERLGKEAVEQFPGAAFYSSAEEMFAKEKLDVVVVATPHDLHAPFALAALGAGVNVILEKPMATTYADCVAMIAAAKKHKRFVTVFHNRRLDGWYLAAKAVIEAGLLGEVFAIHSGIHFAPGPQTWRGYKARSGGLFFDWGSHLVDYALNFANSEVRGVSGFVYRAPEADPELNEDHCEARIFFESGAVAHITVSAVDPVNPYRYRIMGAKGTLLDEWKWGDHDTLTVHTRMSGYAAKLEVPYRRTVCQRYYDNIAAHLCDGAPLMVTPESAAKVIDIFCTAERSSALGGAVLPLEESEK